MLNTSFLMGNALPVKENREGNEAVPPPPPPPPGQEQPQTSTCEICIEPMQLPAQKFALPKECYHPFCSDCMIKYISAKLDDNISKICCPALHCNQFLDPLTCQALIGPQLFLRWCDVLCESVIMGLERSYCPNRDCSALIVNECGRGRGETARKATCPICKGLFCFQCMLPWHAGIGCEEIWEFGEREDMVFGILAKKRKWRRCPKCRHFVERVHGCFIIQCRCHALFCYNCGAEVNQHSCKCQRVRRASLWICLIIVFLMVSFAFFLV